MICKAGNIVIRGIESTVPTKVKDIKDYYDILGERRVKKQSKLTGVRQTRIENDDQTVADLCIVGANRLLDNLSWDVKDIRALILVTQNPSIIMPSTAFIIQKYLGVPKDCVVFDVNLGCSGYVTGLHIISSLMQEMPVGSKGLLLVGDTQFNKNFVPPTTDDELADKMLFGVCGTTTALEVVKDSNVLLFEDNSYGERYKTLSMYYNKPSFMDGEAVFEFAMNEVSDNINKFINNTEALGFNKPDYYIFHQAQKYMLENVALNCNIDVDKVLYSLRDYGNTSSASIPLTICLNSALFSEDRMVLLCGFGIGMACAISQFTMSKSTVLGLHESDIIYPF